MTKQEFFEYCFTAYGTSPDYPFEGDFETAVLRHEDNRKWYALVMRVSRRRFGLDSDEVIDAVNMKVPVAISGSFIAADGIYPAYHMNKEHWITVVLDGSVSAEDIITLMTLSFNLTKKKPPKRRAAEN